MPNLFANEDAHKVFVLLLVWYDDECKRDIKGKFNSQIGDLRSILIRFSFVYAKCILLYIKQICLKRL
jgi:hypothetical protein